MLLRRFYDETLAQASYLIGCQATGAGIVVDPARDPAPYLEAARAEGVRIAHVSETHIHADFLSGARELARRAGAELLLSGEGGDGWRYTYAAGESRVRLLHDGDAVQVGHVRLDVRHTPGHTPEHLTFVVTDEATSSEPMGALTGDFVFVGDVGRPDLLERVAGQAGSAEAAAHRLFRSIAAFRLLPGWLQLWPGHGAGSACGKSLGAVPQSTLGYERLANWGLRATDEDAFVAEVLAGQPAPPPYFARMKRLNRDGAPLLAELPPPRALSPDEVRGAVRGGAVVVDTRPSARFAEEHLAGALSLPAGRSLGQWAGWLLPDDRDVVLLTDGGADGAAAIRSTLHAIGIDRVVGVAAADAVLRAVPGAERRRTAQTTPAELAPAVERGAAHVVDVRLAHEWARGHLPGVPNVPLGELSARLDELPREAPIVLHCQGGARSLIAASVLERAGFAHVVNMSGGFQQWEREGLPVERGAAAPATA